MPNWRLPEFEWDDGNEQHLIGRHSVYPEDAEAVFFNRPFIRRVGDQFEVLGRDDSGRFLFLMCLERQSRIRIFSGRDMTVTERRRYERQK